MFRAIATVLMFTIAPVWAADVRTLSAAELETFLAEPRDVVIIDARMPNERLGDDGKSDWGLRCDDCTRFYAPFDLELGFEDDFKPSLRGKRVLVVCTIGIRSKPAAVAMSSLVSRDTVVWQLEGGLRALLATQLHGSRPR